MATLSPPAAPAPGPEFLSVSELAERLRVKEDTLYAALADGTVPGAVRIRGVWRVHLPTFLAGGGTAAPSPRPSRVAPLLTRGAR
jgi:excisionase family DNA binding protein